MKKHAYILTQSTFGFSVNGEWDGEDVHDF